jgi:hypothetical protein
VIVVIQCAGSKRPAAGTLRTADGKPVLFVAQPDKAPPTDTCVYARPDDPAPSGRSWRETLLAYNESPGTNPLGLLPAYELYKNEIYRALVRRYGIENTYILSAGWGLLNAAFLTPSYDITFSASAEDFVRRRKGDRYRDFRILPDDIDMPIVFFGSKEYVPLFASLTRSLGTEKLVFYNSQQPPVADGCVLKKYETRTRTNWQYECAAAFINRERRRVKYVTLYVRASKDGAASRS